MITAKGTEEHVTVPLSGLRSLQKYMYRSAMQLMKTRLEMKQNATQTENRY